MRSPISTPRGWAALGVLALPTLIVSMDVTLLHLAVPALSADLAPSPTQLLWIVDAYGLLIAALLVPMGTLGDRIGRRRLLLAGGAAFAVASVLAALAPSAETLIAARALLGVAGATLMPSTLALIRGIFTDAAERTFAVGVWVASLSVGVVVGPVAGGALLEVAWWGSVFLLAVPAMAALVVLGPRVLPELRDPAPGRLDRPGVALMILVPSALALGVKRLASDGAEPVALAALGVAVAGGVAFVRRQRRLPDPLVDVTLFRAPAFAGALTANTLGMAATIGVFLLITQHLQVGLGLTPLEAGLALLPYALTILAGSLVAPALAARAGARGVVVGGLAVMAAGVALLSRAEPDAGLALPVTATVVLALGAAPVLALATDLVIAVAPPDRAGSAAAISETGTELGGALGVAVLGSVAAALAGAPAGADAAGTLAAGLGGASLVAAAVLAATAVGVARLMPRQGATEGVPETRPSDARAGG
jgi:DHA2 family multidrug resistance protein-like MFS transporter